MNKYWQVPNTKNIVLIRNENIYYGKYETEIISSNEITEIPKYFDKISLKEIKKIENKEKSKYLKFYYRNSVKKIFLENEKIKSEIIEFIKVNLSEFKYWKDLPTNIEYAKGHYFLIAFILFCFSCSLYFYIGISNGENYPLRNMKVGILHLCLYLAEIGVLKFIPLYSIIFGFIIYSLKKKLRTKGYVETLKKKNN